MKYKEYKFRDVFSVEPVNKLSIPGKNYIMDRDIIDKDGTVPYIAAISTNNGITGYSSKYKANNMGDCITLSTTADSSNTVFYQENDFIGRQQIASVRRKDGQYMGHYVGLYIASIIKKITNGFSYSNKLTKDYLSNCTILLPVTTKYLPDFDSLDIFVGGTDMSDIDTSSWKEFRLDDLFEKIKIEKISGKANDFPTYKTNEYTIPLLTAGVDNQGFARYAKKAQCPTILKNAISISANGTNTGATFYQKNEFSVLQDAYAIKLKNEEIPNEQVGLFLASCISKILHGNFSWSYKAGWERVKNMTIKLPVKVSEEIDWDYMQERISELEQYLIATGLNDYELTDEDKEILQMFKNNIKKGGVKK